MKITLKQLRSLVREAVAHLGPQTLTEASEPVAAWWISPEGTPKTAPTQNYHHEDLEFILSTGALSTEDIYRLSGYEEKGKPLGWFEEQMEKEWYNLDIDPDALMNEMMKRGWARVRLWKLPTGNLLSLGGWTLTESHLRGLQGVFDDSPGARRPDTRVELSQESPPKAAMSTSSDVRSARRLADLGW